jgi:hypothetical protein
MSSPLKKQISLKEFQIVVDDFTKKTMHVDREELIRLIMETYMDELGSDIKVVKTSRNPSVPQKEVREFIDVPQFHCSLKWYKHPFDDKQTGFKMVFLPKKEGQTTFDHPFANFLHFYDNPNGLFRLEALSFLFQ